ncbi:MAG: serine/threonine-protein kinase [Acidobacteria bacterium]|nr:MAG: serine/threonine-protein kinase [Acidobacteriota bacterium]
MSSESMSLESGTKLASYEILGLLGAGGMGEVYRAKDTKLGRDVAIKVLPEAFAQDEERLARFEREARILAALNHPGIATLYGLEESAGTSYLVMELVEGETLRERFDRGPIPWDEAMALFQQIAEALDAAHEKNIVHRDLKPANAKITPEEQIKVLDFGLAKDYEPGGKDIGLSDSPTLAKDDTRDGTILGTPAYMSPEQARGKGVDKRTDIWAFGCCLFEALSGTSPFARDTLSDTLSAVLRDEPEWDALPKTLPAHIEPLLRHCLVKDPKHRLRDIGDALTAMKGSFPAGRAEPPRKPTWAPVALGLGLLAMAYALYNSFVPSTSTPAHVRRLVITLPPEQTLASGSSDVIVFSPDGSRLVYVAKVNGKSRLYLRELDAFEAQPIANTEGAAAPFFSPDGEMIGFFVDDEIRRAKLSGDVATLINSLTRLTNVEPQAVWGSNGEIIFATTRFDGLYRVDAAGGEPEILSTIRIEQGERSHRRPFLLPNGKLLFSVETSDGFRTAVLSRATGEHRLVAGVGATGPDTRYVGSGHLVYGQSGALFAVPFDIDELEGSGSPVPVTPDVRNSLISDFAHFASGGANLAYLTGAEEARVVRVDRDGHSTPIFAQTGDYRYPNLSPNGQRLALTIRGNFGLDVWVYELGRGTRSRLTTDGRSLFPTWYPDGERVTFSTGEGLFITGADGSGEIERLDVQGRALGPRWSPDGQTLAFFTDPRSRTGVNIKLFRDESLAPFAAGEFHESSPQFSPNGRWLAYISDESGRHEVYAQAYPGPGEKYTLSNEGGREPVWSRDGREIFYRDGDRFMVVPLQLEPTFSPGTPRMLFEAPYVSNPGGHPKLRRLAGWHRVHHDRNERDGT